MKKITEKIIKFCENELNDKESLSRIRENIISPTLALLKDEMKKSETNDYLMAMLTHLLWPVTCILLTTLVVCLGILFIQLFVIMRQKKI